MCRKLIKFLFKSNRERDRWVDCIYVDLKKAVDKVPHEITMEVGTHWRIEINIKDLGWKTI